MNGPNSQLMEIYGTETVKTAIPVAARVGAGLLGFGLMMHDEAHMRKIMLEAEMMDRIFRELEARKMRQTIEGLGGPGSKQASVEIVEELAKELAKEASMDKEAIGAFIAKMLGGAGQKLLGLAGKAKPGRLKSMLGGAGQRMTAAGGRLRGVAPTVPMTPAAGAAGAPLMGKVTPPKAGGLGWKGKALGFGALGAVGIGAFKGMQKARDVAMTPAGAGRPYRGLGTPGLMHRLSEYGYPVGGPY